MEDLSTFECEPEVQRPSTTHSMPISQLHRSCIFITKTSKHRVPRVPSPESWPMFRCESAISGESGFEEAWAEPSGPRGAS